LLLSLFGAVLIPTSAFAQQEPSDFAICERFSHSGLIDSRDTSIAREQVSRDFKYVCSRTEDRVSRARSVSTGGNVGYGPFSAGLSQASSNADASERIDAICKEGEQNYIENFSYNDSVKSGQHVVEMVNKCIETLAASATESIFGYTTPSVSSDESFNVQFRYSVGKQARHPYKLTNVMVDPAANVKCAEGNKSVILNPGSNTFANAALTCSKAKNVSVRGIFEFTPQDGATTPQLVNFSVDSPAGEELIHSKLRAEYEEKIKALSDQDVEAIKGLLPPHAIVAFNLEGCPAGWTPYKPLYGRFIRGIDKDGKADPDAGKRSLGSPQEDAFQGHWHNIYTNDAGPTSALFPDKWPPIGVKLFSTSQQSCCAAFSASAIAFTFGPGASIWERRSWQSL
jgi:hypothetical protein